MINKSARVRQCMNSMNSNGIQPPTLGMSSHDFSATYTIMEHEQIIELLGEYVDLVFNTEQDKYPNRTVLLLKYNGRSFEWTNSKDTSTRTSQHFDAKRLKEWLKEHIENLFVMVGGALFQQIKGIPMGASAAPMIANLILFIAEYKYIKTIVGLIKHVGDKQWQVPRNLCMDREEFDGIIYSAIGLEFTDETGDNPHKVNYLDMTIWHSTAESKMVCKLYDTRVGLAEKGLVLNKFPQVDLCLPEQSKYGIVTSQCHRYMVTCSEPKHFLQAAVHLRDTFVPKRYCEAKLDKKFTRFLQQHRILLRLRPDAVKKRHQH